MSTSALGIDIGSSAIKVSLVDIDSRKLLASSVSPDGVELGIDAPRPGWAEQNPGVWWMHIVKACQELGAREPKAYSRVEVIGISYQEHGLVLLDKAGKVLRPAIIWCDSRTVDTGRRLTESLGRERWYKEVGNEPGNFTFSKLAWVKENERAAYDAAETAFLPGDYIAYRLTGRALTTREGLSEGMFYNFRKKALAGGLLKAAGLNPGLIPEPVESFSDQGRLTDKAAAALGLPSSARVMFRAGDQHANAVGLGVTEPNMSAGAAGTSGVIFAVSDKAVADRKARVNSFLHATAPGMPDRYAVLLCINAVGCVYSWMRRILSARRPTPLDYEQLNRMAAGVPPGAEGVTVLPFGNGGERMLGNWSSGFSVFGVDLNRHGPEHLLRAALEGAVFAFRYGSTILKDLGCEIGTLRTGRAGLFQNREFMAAVSSILCVRIETYDADPAFGAALGAIGAGAGGSGGGPADGLERAAVHVQEPDIELTQSLLLSYERWLLRLESVLNSQ